MFDHALCLNCMGSTWFCYCRNFRRGSVPDPSLRSNNGELAAALGNRTGEFLGTEPVDVQDGALRGNPNRDDWYMMGGFTLSYTIFSDRGGNSKVGRRRGGKQFGCPTF